MAVVFVATIIVIHNINKLNTAAIIHPGISLSFFV